MEPALRARARTDDSLIGARSWSERAEDAHRPFPGREGRRPHAACQQAVGGGREALSRSLKPRREVRSTIGGPCLDPWDSWSWSSYWLSRCSSSAPSGCPRSGVLWAGGWPSFGRRPQTSSAQSSRRSISKTSRREWSERASGRHRRPRRPYRARTRPPPRSPEPDRTRDRPTLVRLIRGPPPLGLPPLHLPTRNRPW